MSVDRMHPADLEALADLVAARLAPMLTGASGPAAPAAAPGELLTARQVAELLGVTRDSVYRRAGEFGARRIGAGPKAPLRFDREKVLEALGACESSREPQPPDRPPRRRSRGSVRQATSDAIPLLPVRGVR